MPIVLAQALITLLLSCATGLAAASPSPRAIVVNDKVFADGFDNFYYVVPYSVDGSLSPSPPSRKLALSTQLQDMDVGFIIGTNGSMASEIAAVRNNLSTVIPSLHALVPSVGVGIAAFDDVPYSTFGITGDLPFYLPASPQGYVTTVEADSQAAVNALATHNGGDAPASQIPAIHHALAGSGIDWTAGSVPQESPPPGTFGAMHFRSGALAIVVNVTDSPQHNGKRALDKTGTTYDAVFQNAYSFSTWNADDAVAQINAVGAKFVGVAADNGVRGVGTADPYGFLAYLTDKTGSNATAEFITRPAGCSPTQCCTGINGAGVAADGPGGACRSVYSINTNGSGGLANAIDNGVSAVLHSARFDVYVQAYSDPAESIDVVDNFMLMIEPDPDGGIDPASGSVCLTIPLDQLADNFSGPKAGAGADGINDTISQSDLASLYCFIVTPKANSTVPATAAPQVFRAWLRILAVKPGGSPILGQDRAIFFLVPAGGA
jgi:hypothetical protein